MMWSERRVLAMVGLVALAWAAPCCAAQDEPRPHLRAALGWMATSQPALQARHDLDTPAKVDALLDRAAELHLNAVYLYAGGPGGYSFHRTDGFDAMQHAVDGCKQRHLDLHAWFSVANAAPGLNPDWLLQDPQGRPLGLVNLNHPAFLDHFARLLGEFLAKYPVRGIVLDWVRFPEGAGDKADFSPTSAALFEQETGEDLRRALFTDFPCVASLAGHAMETPTTAKVLLKTAAGRPIVLLNRLGQGEVVTFNVSERMTCWPLAEAARKALAADDGSATVLVQDAPDGTPPFVRERVAQLLTSLGCEPIWCRDVVDALNHVAQAPTARLLLPFSGQRFSELEVLALRSAVDQGLRLVLLNPPTACLPVRGFAELVGASTAGLIEESEITLVPGEISKWIKWTGFPAPEEAKVNLWRQWQHFKLQTVTRAVTRFRDAGRQVWPDLKVAAMVLGAPGDRDRYQDWGNWLKNGTVDYVLAADQQPSRAALQAQVDQLAAAGLLDKVVLMAGDWTPTTDPAALGDAVSLLSGSPAAGLFLSPCQLLDVGDEAHRRRLTNGFGAAVKLAYPTPKQPG